MEEQLIKDVEAVIMKYCVPKQEYTNIQPKQVAEEVIEVVKSALNR